MPLHYKEIGPITLSSRGSEPVYSLRQNLEQISSNCQIIYLATENQPTDEMRYSYVEDDTELAFIRGHYKNPSNFNINRIENPAKDGCGHIYISMLFNAMLKHLQDQGVTDISTLAVARLAPVLIRRYGFVDEKGRDYDRLKKSRHSKIPGKAFYLTRKI